MRVVLIALLDFMMKIFYVSDTKEKKRILVEFRKIENARKYCSQLNDNHHGRFIHGDWCERKEFGVDVTREWPWVAQSNSRDYLV